MQSLSGSTPQGASSAENYAGERQSSSSSSTTAAPSLLLSGALLRLLGGSIGALSPLEARLAAATAPPQWSHKFSAGSGDNSANSAVAGGGCVGQSSRDSAADQAVAQLAKQHATVERFRSALTSALDGHLPPIPLSNFTATAAGRACKEGEMGNSNEASVSSNSSMHREHTPPISFRTQQTIARALVAAFASANGGLGDGGLEAADCFGGEPTARRWLSSGDYAALVDQLCGTKGEGGDSCDDGLLLRESNNVSSATATATAAVAIEAEMERHARILSIVAFSACPRIMAPDGHGGAAADAALAALPVGVRKVEGAGIRPSTLRPLFIDRRLPSCLRLSATVGDLCPLPENGDETSARNMDVRGPSALALHSRSSRRFVNPATLSPSSSNSNGGKNNNSTNRAVASTDKQHQQQQQQQGNQPKTPQRQHGAVGGISHSTIALATDSQFRRHAAVSEWANNGNGGSSKDAAACSSNNNNSSATPAFSTLEKDLNTAGAMWATRDGLLPHETLGSYSSSTCAYAAPRGDHSLGHVLWSLRLASKITAGQLRLFRALLDSRRQNEGDAEESRNRKVKEERRGKEEEEARRRLSCAALSVVDSLCCLFTILHEYRLGLRNSKSGIGTANTLERSGDEEEIMFASSDFFRGGAERKKDVADNTLFVFIDQYDEVNDVLTQLQGTARCEGGDARAVADRALAITLGLSDGSSLATSNNATTASRLAAIGALTDVTLLTGRSAAPLLDTIAAVYGCCNQRPTEGSSRHPLVNWLLSAVGAEFGTAAPHKSLSPAPAQVAEFLADTVRAADASASFCSFESKVKLVEVLLEEFVFNGLSLSSSSSSRPLVSLAPKASVFEEDEAEVNQRSQRALFFVDVLAAGALPLACGQQQPMGGYGGYSSAFGGGNPNVSRAIVRLLGNASDAHVALLANAVLSPTAADKGSSLGATSTSKDGVTSEGSGSSPTPTLGHYTKHASSIARALSLPPLRASPHVLRRILFGWTADIAREQCGAFAVPRILTRNTEEATRTTVAGDSASPVASAPITNSVSLSLLPHKLPLFLPAAYSSIDIFARTSAVLCGAVMELANELSQKKPSMVAAKLGKVEKNVGGLTERTEKGESMYGKRQLEEALAALSSFISLANPNGLVAACAPSGGAVTLEEAMDVPFVGVIVPNANPPAAITVGQRPRRGSAHAPPAIGPASAATTAHASAGAAGGKGTYACAERRRRAELLLSSLVTASHTAMIAAKVLYRTETMGAVSESEPAPFAVGPMAPLGVIAATLDLASAIIQRWKAKPTTGAGPTKRTQQQQRGGFAAHANVGAPTRSHKFEILVSEFPKSAVRDLLHLSVLREFAAATGAAAGDCEKNVFGGRIEGNVAIAGDNDGEAVRQTMRRIHVSGVKLLFSLFEGGEGAKSPYVDATLYPSWLLAVLFQHAKTMKPELAADRRLQVASSQQEASALRLAAGSGAAPVIPAAAISATYGACMSALLHLYQRRLALESRVAANSSPRLSESERGCCGGGGGHGGKRGGGAVGGGDSSAPAPPTHQGPSAAPLTTRQWALQIAAVEFGAANSFARPRKAEANEASSAIERLGSEWGYTFSFAGAVAVSGGNGLLIAALAKQSPTATAAGVSNACDVTPCGINPSRDTVFLPLVAALYPTEGGAMKLGLERLATREWSHPKEVQMGESHHQPSKREAPHAVTSLATLAPAHSVPSPVAMGRASSEADGKPAPVATQAARALFLPYVATLPRCTSPFFYAKFMPPTVGHALSSGKPSPSGGSTDASITTLEHCSLSPCDVVRHFAAIDDAAELNSAASAARRMHELAAGRHHTAMVSTLVDGDLCRGGRSTSPSGRRRAIPAPPSNGTRRIRSAMDERRERDRAALCDFWSGVSISPLGGGMHFERRTAQQ